MAAVSVGPSLNSRLSGTDAFRLRNVTFSDDLPHLRVHHTGGGGGARYFCAANVSVTCGARSGTTQLKNKNKSSRFKQKVNTQGARAGASIRVSLLVRVVVS